MKTQFRLGAFIVLLGAALGCSGGDEESEDSGSGGSGGEGGTGGSDDPAGTGGSDGSDGLDTCPGTIVATWEVDGTSLASSSTTYVAAGTWGITIVECIDDDKSGALVFSHIPLPVAVGTYTLTSTLLHGAQTTGEPGAFYTVDDGTEGDTRYFTNTTESGELVITEVNTETTTLSGTFSFSAINDSGTKTIEVVGELTDVEFYL